MLNSKCKSMMQKKSKDQVFPVLNFAFLILN